MSRIDCVAIGKCAKGNKWQIEWDRIGKARSLKVVKWLRVVKYSIRTWWMHSGIISRTCLTVSVISLSAEKRTLVHYSSGNVNGFVWEMVVSGGGTKGQNACHLTTNNECDRGDGSCFPDTYKSLSFLKDQLQLWALQSHRFQVDMIHDGFPAKRDTFTLWMSFLYSSTFALAASQQHLTSLPIPRLSWRK